MTLRSALLATAASISTAVLASLLVTRAPADDGLEALKTAFIRPDVIPFTKANLWSAEKAALGKALFSDKRLSGDGTVACATCHDPALGFSDGVRTGRGVAGTPLLRHTPALWNLAWDERYFWDGRSASMEEQAAGPIEHPAEMGSSLPEIAARLGSDPRSRKMFKTAFPQESAPTPATILAALATYERTLVSPLTRFDRWVAGDERALTAQEIAGFKLFTGPAGCTNCHSGWAFTDRAFHDIGLPASGDLGRGGVINVPAAHHAFKTPTLRELAWTAPYMHDGSIATLEGVVRHYAASKPERPSLSPDLPRIDASDVVVDALVAFLGTLSSEAPPKPLALKSAAVTAEAPAEPVSITTTISQREKLFTPDHLTVNRGAQLTIANDDTRTHNVRSDNGPTTFNSGAQEPGESVTVNFPKRGLYRLYCGIHPTMKLDVSVR